MPFEFNPQQSSKSTDKSDKPSFDFNIKESTPKPAETSKPAFDFGQGSPTPKPSETSKPAFDFAQGAPTPKPSESNKPAFDLAQGAPTSKSADNKAAATKKTNIAAKPVSKSTSKPTSKSDPAKTSKNGSKSADSSGRGKRKAAPKNLFQDKKVMIFAGVGVAILLLIIVAIASNSGSDSAPQQAVHKKLTPEEARRERLRKLEAKYDAQYAVEKSGPKTEKQKLMIDAESKLKRGDYQGAVDTYIKVHQMDPTDGYPVTQLINIYRNNLHNNAQAEKWEQVNNDIAKGNLDQLHKKSEEKYNKSKD